MSARIPMARDVAEWIGNAAERIDNRSLLLEKFCFHKSWPVANNERGDQIKWDEASRWSFVRIADGGEGLLLAEADEKLRRANGRKIASHNAEKLRAEAALAQQLANTRVQTKDIVELRQAQSRRWLDLLLKSTHAKPHLIVGKLEARMAINLADGLIENAGICMDRLYGVPYIPGSAVKGVCRHTALSELRQANGSGENISLSDFVILFGCSEADWKEKGELARYSSQASAETKIDRRGSIVFLPAYPLEEAGIEVDLTNVHYPEYYRTGRDADLKKEQPRPNPFPSVGAGTRFLFGCVPGSGADDRLLALASRLLETALTTMGIGAKTAAGYGWFSIDNEYLQTMANEAAEAVAKEKDRREAAEKEKEEREAKAAELAAMPPLEREMARLKALNEQDFAETAKTIDAADEITAEAMLTLLRDDRDKRDKWKRWKKKKPEIVGALTAAASKRNISLP